MFGFNPRLAQLAKQAGAGGGSNRSSALSNMERDIKQDAPQQLPRWAQALQGVGATMQDMGASYDGRQGGHINAWNDQQERVRSSTEDARRRQLRFQHLRDTVPESDTSFWQAYAMGGEEAAMQALQARQGRDFQREMAQGSQDHQRGMAQDQRDFQASEGEAGRDIQRQGLGIDRARLGLEADRLDHQIDQDNRPPEVVRVVDAMGLEGEERDSALRLMTGVDQPRNSRDSVIASVANDVISRFPDGDIPPEEVTRLQGITNAIYQNDRPSTGMGFNDAFAMTMVLQNLDETTRNQVLSLMNGGEDGSEPESELERLEAAEALLRPPQ